jgi:hypothetical protein
MYNVIRRLLKVSGNTAVVGDNAKADVRMEIQEPFPGCVKGKADQLGREPWSGLAVEFHS